jgi:hypothetical protein
MSFRNLSKVFRYENSDGNSITFVYENGYLINKPVGIDTVSVSLSQAQGIDQVGVTVQSKNVQPRPVNISGILVGDSQAENKNVLMSVIRPDLPGRLYADDYYIDVNVTATPTIGPEPEFAAFQFSLIAPYPYWSQDESIGVALAAVDPKFRLWDGDDSHLAPDGTLGSWNISGEYSFGEVIEEQFFSVFNTGQLPVPFTTVITAKGIVSNPKITDVESGKYLLLNYTMSAGERIEVEITHERTYVTSSVNGDIRGALSLKSTFNRLSVGKSIIKPEANSGGASMEIAISFSNEIVGIAV